MTKKEGEMKVKDKFGSVVSLIQQKNGLMIKRDRADLYGALSRGYLVVKSLTQI